MPSQLHDARSNGRTLVFSAIRRNAPVARVDIAKITNLSPATVTSITAELLTAGLIEEVAVENSGVAGKRGRPRVDLKIRGAAHIVVGIKLSDNSATYSFLDFEGKKIAGYVHPSAQETYCLPELMTFLTDGYSAALTDAGLEESSISGMGLGLPGVVDAEAGIVLWSPVLIEKNQPLQQKLADTFSIPVFIDNDANLVAVAEKHIGLGKNAQNFVVITVEQGVGLGIVINGKIYRGTKGCGAELGHTKVQLDGALCRCGQRGCLEAYVGDYALLREAGTAMGPLEGANPQEQMQALLAAAKKGNTVAQSIIRRAGRMFSMGLANVVNIFAPELIILSGERLQDSFLYGDEVINDMKKYAVQSGDLMPEVKIHSWDNQMWSIGAATFAIDGIIDIALAKIR
ncbi:MAG: ROK family transcriptional regulator [Rhodobacteraceae bacterium]|nr:ROK family transcriptional regulator [Paracoccaceae bacterium]